MQLSSFHTRFGRDFCLFQQYLSELNKMENLYTARLIRPSAFSHLTDNASCLHAAKTPAPTPLPKKMDHLGFSFLLGITIASREIEDNAYAYAGWGGGGGKQGVFWEMWCKW